MVRIATALVRRRRGRCARLGARRSDDRRIDTVGNQAQVMCADSRLAKAFVPNLADGTLSVIEPQHAAA